MMRKIAMAVFKQEPMKSARMARKKKGVYLQINSYGSVRKYGFSIAFSLHYLILAQTLIQLISLHSSLHKT
jgi:hypothetical protein